MAKKLSDEAITALLWAAIQQATGHDESKLAKEREKVNDYYEGIRPLPGKGVADFNSRDVLDSVENMKAQLLEVFSGNTQPASFPPLNPQDVAAAQIATEYVNYVVFTQNNGFEIFDNVIHNSLLGRNGICKVWWDEKYIDDFIEVNNVGLGDLQAFIATQKDASIDEMDMHIDDITVKRAVIKYKKDMSKVKIIVLPPEDFGITATAKSIREAELVWHRQLMTATELMKQGYSKSIVDDLQQDEEAWFVTQPERLQRYRQTDDIIGMRENGINQPALRHLLVYECYSELDIDNSGEAALWKITMCGKTILDKEQVSRKPFISYCPMPRPHTFWGESFAKLMLGTQVAKTYLTRSIIDHAMITNNPRYLVAKGALMNPRELMENTIGGVINVNSLEAVAPMPQPSLNPFVYQTIQMLDQSKQSISGISDLSTGLNKDVISSQNSAEMVDQMMTASQLRQKKAARCFAHGFMTDLYREVYKLVCENENRDNIQIVCGGQWVAISPSGWEERENLAVEFNLGYGEQDREKMKWVQLDQYLSQPGLAPFYTPPNRYAVITKALQAGGIKDVNTYLLPLAQVKPPPPDPLQQAEIAMKNADAAVKQANAQMSVEKLKLEQQTQAQNYQLEMAKLEFEKQKFQAQMQLNSDKLAHDVATNAAELTMQHEAMLLGKATAVIEPTHL